MASAVNLSSMSNKRRLAGRQQSRSSHRGAVPVRLWPGPQLLSSVSIPGDAHAWLLLHGPWRSGSGDGRKRPGLPRVPEPHPFPPGTASVNTPHQTLSPPGGPGSTIALSLLHASHSVLFTALLGSASGRADDSQVTSDAYLVTFHRDRPVLGTKGSMAFAEKIVMPRTCSEPDPRTGPCRSSRSQHYRPVAGGPEHCHRAYPRIKLPVDCGYHHLGGGPGGVYVLAVTAEVRRSFCTAVALG